jgi:hypothetical protein
VFGLVLVLAGGVPLAQGSADEGPVSAVAPGPSDLEISSRLAAVILEQTVSPGSVNTVVEIPASQDTYVASNRPNQNYGLSPELRLGYSLSGANDGALRTFVQFDVAGHVPADATINGATLRTFLFATSPAFDGPMTVEARHLQTAWLETAVTWNSHQPVWGGVAGTGQVSSILGWHDTDVTGLVREWQEGARANNGLLIIGDERVQSRERKFHSLNAGNNFFPRLVVDFTEASPPVSVITPFNPTITNQDSFVVAWTSTTAPGTDIDYFDVRYRFGNGPWVEWLSQTKVTSALFTDLNALDGPYFFEVRARDTAGRLEAWTEKSEASISVDRLPPFMEPKAWLPFVERR